MPSILNVQFPVPTRFVPRRGRVENLAFAKGTAPARLVEVSPSEMRTVANLRLPGRHGVLSLREFDGNLWRPVLTEPVAKPDEVGRKILFRQHFEDWVEGRSVFHALGPYHGVTRHFSGTPLVARLYGKLGETRFDESYSPGRVRDMVEDGHERAAANVAAFMDQGVLVAGDRVFVRARGPLAVTPDFGLTYQLLPMPGAFEHHHVYSEPHAARPGRLAEHAAALRASRGMEPLGAAPGTQWSQDDISGLPESDDDLMLFLNQEPRRILHALDRPDLMTAVAEGMGREDHDALRSLAAWGAVGGARREEARETLRILRSAWSAARDRIRQPGFGRMSEVILDGYLALASAPPAAPSNAHGEEDLEALSGLRVAYGA